MWHPRNTARALAVVLGLLLIGAWVRPAYGQGELLNGSEAGDALPFETADGGVAYGMVEGWVRSGHVPGDDAVPVTERTGVFGVYVTLRDDGRLVGKGTALRPDLTDTIDTPGPPVDIALLLAAATRDALADAERTQKQRALDRGITDPVLVEANLRALLGRLLVDVQVGYGLESVVLPASGPVDAVFAQFVPGDHGLRMSGPLMPTGDLIWPANALARNTSPRSQLVQLLKRQGFQEEDLLIVARPAGPQLERFSVVHYCQAGRNQQPRQLIRGNIVVPRRSLDSQALDGLAERISRHLEGKVEVLNDGTLVMRGPFHPSYNRIDPDLAGVRQGALACFAMMVQSRAMQQRIPGDRTSRDRAAKALSVIETLLPIAHPEEGPLRPVPAALLLLAMCESPVPVDMEARDALGRALMGLSREEGGFRDPRATAEQIEEGKDRLGRATEAVITAALASWYTVMGVPDDAVRRVVWRSMQELVEANRGDEGGARLADLTWLTVGLSRAGEALARAAEGGDGPDAYAAMQAFLAEQVQMLIDQQVQGRPLLGPDDVAGGYLTRAAPAGAAPDPTWESAMPLAIISTLLRDDGVIPPDEIYGPVLSAQLGARFIAQLLITNTNAYYVRDVAAASGGVRRSLWDNTLDLDCSSLALIAISELQASLHALDERDAPE